jgi:hypothetical protein
MYFESTKRELNVALVIPREKREGSPKKYIVTHLLSV